MEENSLVQRKLKQSDKCLTSIKTSVVKNLITSPRIACIVQSGTTDHAIFLFATTNNLPSFPEDLYIDTVITIGQLFAYELDTSNKESLDIPVTLNDGKNSAIVLFPKNSKSKEFMEHVKQARNDVLQNYALGLPSSFSWLDKYNSTKTRDAALLQDDPFKRMNLNPGGTSGRHSTPVVKAPALTSNMSSEKILGFEDSSMVSVGSKSMFIDSSSSNDDRELTESLRRSRSRPTVSKRERIYKMHMDKMQDQYTDTNTFRIFCGTWNVNGQPASISLHDWLSCDEDPPDIYAVGFQELDLSKEAFLFNDSSREQDWLDKVQESLHPKRVYVMMKHVRLVGMLLVICIRRDLIDQIKNVVATQAATGILGMMGNKGGVAIRFDFQETSFCFVNAHLAAHAEEYERRNQDYKDINAKIQFMGPTWTSKSITDHGRIFWIGDFNYRFTGNDIEGVKKRIENGHLDELLYYDQLRTQWKLKKVFQDFEEPPISFKPTYKYNTGTDDWDSSEKCRCPAWCDRILFRGNTVVNRDYRSHMMLRISDHKPVSAIFDVGVKKIDSAKYKKVYEELIRRLDREENEYLPLVTLDSLEVQFKDVVFMAQQSKIITIENTGQVDVQFEFINKLDDNYFCKPWLTIVPSESGLLVGEKMEIEFQVYINKDTAPLLNAGDDTIEDILVLHLEGGKDFFISISGNYIASCFGSSLEALVNMYQPIREVPTSQLIDLEHIPTTPKGTESFNYNPTTQDIEPLDIPKELWRMIDHIYQHGRNSEELFQQPGSIEEIQKIRDCLDMGTPDRLPGTVNSVAEALLVFLEALPEPVIPYALFEQCLHSSTSFDESKKVLQEMPRFHHNIFIYLSAFLRELLKSCRHNNLDIDTLASIFGSVLLRIPSARRNKSRSRQRENELKAKFITLFLLNEYDI